MEREERKMGDKRRGPTEGLRIEDKSNVEVDPRWRTSSTKRL